jgi:hypothetical protein
LSTGSVTTTGATVTIGAVLKRVTVTSIGGVFGAAARQVDRHRRAEARSPAAAMNFNGSGLVPELGSRRRRAAAGALLRGLAFGT